MDITVKEFNNLNLAKKGKKPILCYGCWAKAVYFMLASASEGFRRIFSLRSPVDTVFQ